MKRFTKTVIASAIACVALPTFAADNKVKINLPADERTQIEAVVHQYLLKNPEVVVEALQAMQRKQYDEAQQVMKQTQKDATKQADNLFHQANDPFTGSDKPKVTVVEFFDYQCPHCVDMAPVIEGIVKNNPDVKVVFKDFPIRGPMSDLAARAAIAANLQGKYYELNHALLNANQQLTEASIYEIAGKAGLNVDQLKKDMKDNRVDAQLKANKQLAEDLKLFGTPAFFIANTNVANNKGTIVYVPGQMNQEQLQSEIDKAK